MVAAAALVNVAPALALDTFTGWVSRYRRLAGVLVLAVMAVATAVITGFRLARSGPAGCWSFPRPWLYCLAGVQSVEWTVLTVLIGETATGIFKELWFRGLPCPRLKPGAQYRRR